MFGTHDLYLFVLSCVLLNLTPGQDTLYIVGRSISLGRKAGILSALGIMSGVLVHTTLAAFGLSAVLATSALAFSLVKYAGAGYLMWIGIEYIRNGRGETPVKPEARNRCGHWALYRQGLLTNILNPKVSLFFLSFLPQFVDPGVEFVFLPFLLLGMIFFTTGSIWCLILVFASSWLTDRFRNPANTGGMLKKLTGALFVGLGIRLAFSPAE